MHRRQYRRAHEAREGEGEEINVAVDDIERIGVLEDATEFEHLRRMDIARHFEAGQKTQAGRDNRHEIGERLGISRCKKRHIVPAPDKFIGQCRDDTLGTAILQWRDTFG